jgi:hypothetical protein
MNCTQIRIESRRIENGLVDNTGPSSSAGKLVGLMTLFAAAMAITLQSRLTMAGAKKLDLPYATIDHPQFVSASQAYTGKCPMQQN